MSRTRQPRPYDRTNLKGRTKPKDNGYEAARQLQQLGRSDLAQRVRRAAARLGGRR